MTKSPDAFRTISEVADWLGLQAHVLRFWESKFTQVKPIKRAGGRRYYRPADMLLLGGIKKLLHEDGLTIKGVQKILREQGVSLVADQSQALDDLTMAVIEGSPDAGSEGADDATIFEHSDDLEDMVSEEDQSTPEAPEPQEDAPVAAPMAAEETAAPEVAAEPEVAPEVPEPQEDAPVAAPVAAEETAAPEVAAEPEIAPDAPEVPEPQEDAPVAAPVAAEETAAPEVAAEPEVAPDAPETLQIDDATAQPTASAPSADNAEPDLFDAVDQNAEAENATPDEASPDMEAMPSFQRQPQLEQETAAETALVSEASDEAQPAPAPPPSSEAGSDEPDDTPAPDTPSDVIDTPQAPKPRVVDVTFPPPEEEIPIKAATLASVARTRTLAPEKREALKPLLAQLIRLRASMASPRKDTHKD